MTAKHLLTTINPPTSPGPLRISYLISSPPNTDKPIATILLIHGFPQTSHQFRHIIPVLTFQGYRCIAPDYRGAGSSKSLSNSHDFRKTTMAQDVIHLLDHLNITEPIHVVGHDRLRPCITASFSSEERDLGRMSTPRDGGVPSRQDCTFENHSTVPLRLPRRTRSRGSFGFRQRKALRRILLQENLL